MIIASAPAKIILFGEHAVVYGQPAIAVPVSSLRATAHVETNAHLGLRIAIDDLDEVLPVNIETDIVDNALAITGRLVLQQLGVSPPDVTIHVQSDIPVASGLGSGAAVSTALALALCQVLGRSLDNAQLNQIIYEVEKIHHGTPSGIDNTVIVYEQPVYFVREQPIETIHIHQPFQLLIADTGQRALTRIAVGDVRKLYESHPARTSKILQAIGDIVVNARHNIENGNIPALGRLMNDNHACLQALTVSSPELDCLVQAALQAGAFGAKLSGGGRGGNMIALVDETTSAKVQAALLAAGAARVYQTQVG
jgi:mevalonate kinase